MAVYDLIYFNIITLFCHCGFSFFFSVICYPTLDSPKLAELLMDSLAKDYVPLAASWEIWSLQGTNSSIKLQSQNLEESWCK